MDYTKATDFAAKDALLTGNPAKLVKGIELDAEFNNISTAVATKYDSTDLGVTLQQYDADLAAIAALAKTDGNIIVGDGSTWVAESGATARTSLGAAALTANTFTGLQTWKASADIASGATVDLTAATGNTTRITGTTATSAFTMTAGQWHLCIADGVWPLTYHATTNKLNTGADYTCQAGDRLLLVKDDDNIVHGIIFPALATQAEMEAGTATGIRLMTPERVAQAIAALASGSSLTIGSFTDWTSGAYKDITGLPSGTKRFKVKPVGMSTNGTSIMIVQLGDAGGIETSGYTGTVETGGARSSFSSGIMLTQSGSAAFSLDGELTFELADSSTNTWTCSGVMSGNNSAAASYSISGAKALSGELTQFRVTTVGGSDTGDAGGFGYSVEV